MARLTREQIEQAGETLDAALERLEQLGLVEPSEDDPDTRVLSTAGIVAFLDLATVFRVQTAGEQLPAAWHLARDVAGAMTSCLGALVFGTGADVDVHQFQRQAIRQLRATVRRHRY